MTDDLAHAERNRDSVARPTSAHVAHHLGDEDGDVTVLAEGKEKKILVENTLGSSVYSTAVAANGALYFANRNQLWALQVKP